MAQAGSPVGGPSNPSVVGKQGPNAGFVPFRRATTPRTNISVTSQRTMSAATQPVSEQVEGTGYIVAINLEVVNTTAGNAAAVAFFEDAPWSVLDTVSFSDSNGESLSLSGFELYLTNLYAGFYNRILDTASTDTNVYQAVTGGGATGGSFRFHVLIPVAINPRNFLGVLGNQDRAMKYQLRSDVASGAAAATGPVFTTAPTSFGTLVINRTYVNITVPTKVNAGNQQQQQLPSKWGVIHYLTRSINSSPPQGSATVNHFLPRLGNTIRVLIVILRSNGSRATAETNLPTRTQFLLGDTPIFQESIQYRRRLMRQRYGFDAPPGVLVYDFMTDIVPWVSGAELGVDWLWTNGLANAQFTNTYPAGMGSTNNSMVVITDDLLIPPGVDVYAPDAY